MSGLIYQDQSAYDLKLNVVEGPLDLKQFSHLRTGRIDISSGFSVDATIIGTSHFLRFRLKGLVFYEVCACTDVKTGSRKIYNGHLGEEGSEVDLTFAGKGRYRFRSRMLGLKYGVDELRLMEKLALEKQGSQSLGLFFRFPAAKSEVAPKTIVILGTRERGEIVFAKTAHLYPDENTVVFTETNLLSFRRIREHRGCALKKHSSPRKEEALCEA